MISFCIYYNFNFFININKLVKNTQRAFTNNTSLFILIFTNFYTFTFTFTLISDFILFSINKLFNQFIKMYLKA